MIFALKRIDGEEDPYTKLRFKTYDEAYDYLEKFFGQDCCSDTDYEKNNYYLITEEN